MRILFCKDPLSKFNPDPAYQKEVDAVRSSGLDYSLINFEALVYEEDIYKALKQVDTPLLPELCIYRGWMLTPSQYRFLYYALKDRNSVLINSPEQYKHCHYLPESYHLIKDHTPLTIYFPYEVDLEMDILMEQLSVFDGKPVVVRDYAKSRKHNWFDACYIPSASNRSEVEKIVSRFVELQGEDLNEGLVFREYVDLKPLGSHPQSGMPLTEEHRLFYFNDKLISVFEYWEGINYKGNKPPLDQFNEVAQGIESLFFTMDVAQKKNGEWIIVELGDGQVSGLPEHANLIGFYSTIAEQSKRK
jgi:hypothetical protein